MGLCILKFGRQGGRVLRLGRQARGPSAAARQARGPIAAAREPSAAARVVHCCGRRVRVLKFSKVKKNS